MDSGAISTRKAGKDAPLQDACGKGNEQRGGLEGKEEEEGQELGAIAEHEVAVPTRLERKRNFERNFQMYRKTCMPNTLALSRPPSQSCPSARPHPRLIPASVSGRNIWITGGTTNTGTLVIGGAAPGHRTVRLRYGSQNSGFVQGRGFMHACVIINRAKPVDDVFAATREGAEDENGGTKYAAENLVPTTGNLGKLTKTTPQTREKPGNGRNRVLPSGLATY